MIDTKEEQEARDKAKFPGWPTTHAKVFMEHGLHWGKVKVRKELMESKWFQALPKREQDIIVLCDHMGGIRSSH